MSHPELDTPASSASAPWAVQVMCEDGPLTKPLPPDLAQPVSLKLRAIPGSTGIWLPIIKKGHPTIVAEIPVNEDEETVRVAIREDLYGKPVVSVANRAVYCIQSDHKFRPPAPQRVSPDANSLDVVLLIDGTARSWTDSGFEPLIGGANWPDHAHALGQFVDAMGRKFAKARYSVVAFGDHGSERLKARDLTPRYALKPEEPAFHVFAGPQSRDSTAGPERALRQLSPTTGGDYVDALAYAMARIASMPWTDAGRKLLVLSGDSPGRSLLAPAPHPADSTARKHDVDAARILLHNAGVEVVTMYHAPSEDSGLLDGDLERELCRHSEAQYRRLATRAEFFVPDALSLNPRDLSDSVMRLTGWYGRGPALGFLSV